MAPTSTRQHRQSYIQREEADQLSFLSSLSRAGQGQAWAGPSLHQGKGALRALQHPRMAFSLNNEQSPKVGSGLGKNLAILPVLVIGSWLRQNKELSVARLSVEFCVEVWGQILLRKKGKKAKSCLLSFASIVFVPSQGTLFNFFQVTQLSSIFILPINSIQN